MQKLVLVAGFKPSVGKCGPKVLLGEGKYRIVAENLNGTQFALCHSSIESECGHDVYIEMVARKDNDYGVWLKVLKAGNEEYINVFAEMVS